MPVPARANGPTLYSLDRRANEVERRISGLETAVSSDLGAVKRLGDEIRDPERGLIVQLAELRRQQEELRRDFRRLYRQLAVLLSVVMALVQVLGPYLGAALGLPQP